MQLSYLINASCCAGVPGVLSVQPDSSFESEIKDYAGFVTDHDGVKTFNLYG